MHSGLVRRQNQVLKGDTEFFELGDLFLGEIQVQNQPSTPDAKGTGSINSWVS